MPVLTDLASAQVKRGVKLLYGTVLSRPALLVSDGLNAVYACDVNVGPTDPTGRIDQYNQQNRHGDVRTDRHGLTYSSDLSGLAGQQDWQPDNAITTNTILHDVVISRNNASLIYADVGSPVILSRSESGRWEITGFSQEQPGTYNLVPVDLGDSFIGSIGDRLIGPVVIGPSIDFSIVSRLLTFGELGTVRPFGDIPLGASALYVGGVLSRIV